MASSKIKILLVVHAFWQAGAQRYAYEISRAIDRKNFELDVLSTSSLNDAPQWEDYYYELHKKNGDEVYFCRDFEPQPLLERVKASLSYRLKIPFPKPNAKDEPNDKLNDFLDRYDVINWIGEYLFSDYFRQLKTCSIEKSVVHIMTSKAQSLIDNYRNIDRRKSYRFVSAFETEQAIMYELSDFSGYAHHYFPLSFELPNRENEWRFTENKSLRKIGIFTRLDSSKPIDQYFYAFHLLLDSLPNLELHVFGNGDPHASSAGRCLNQLHIQDKVKFRGHVPDIRRAALEEDLDLVWFQGVNGVPAGYAAHDLCLTGIPQIYWEILSETAGRKVNQSYPCFNNLRKFTEHSQRLLTDKAVAESQSRRQFEETKNNNDVKKWMPSLEKFFKDIAEKSR